MSRSAHDLIRLLRQGGHWPLDDLPLDSLTFSVPKSEIPFLRNEAVSVESIFHLRPIGDFPQQIYVVDFGNNQMNRFAVRRIAIHLTSKPRTRWNPNKWRLEELVFLLSSASQGFAITAFRGSSALLAEQGLLGPTDGWKDSKFISALQWDLIEGKGICLPDSLYVRIERKRNRATCPRSFILSECPDLIELYDLAVTSRSLTQSEEDTLFIQLGRGDTLARERLLYSQLRPVFNQAYRTYHANEALRPVFADLFSGGVEGVMNAIEKYSFERGHRFQAYCWNWIVQKVERVMVESLWPVEVPYFAWEKLGPAARKYDDLETHSKAPGNYESLESRLGVNDRELRAVRLMVGESYVQGDDELLEEVPDAEVDEAFLDIESQDEILLLTATLRDRDREVLMLRFGCHPDFPEREHTLEEVGQILSITRERVRQIENRALKILRTIHRKNCDMEVQDV